MLPSHKTKIVCTIGPSSGSVPVLKDMIRAGMAVARLNFSHGDLQEHARNIKNIRSAAATLKRPVTILVDLPGPKIRIGKLQHEPTTLVKGSTVTLVARDATETGEKIPVRYRRLPESVRKGSNIYINDGAILLKVEEVSGDELRCRVIVGGKVLSGKGLNIPGAPIFLEPVSERELQFVDFGLKHGVNVFGISFVEKAADILKVKEFARKKGFDVYTVAKIERGRAIDNIEEILDVTDGIMVARGDLGVEIPIESVPVVQKKLILKANMRCRPVITATQMLLSMTDNTRPTRAETTDVANAILDGSDAVMLSEETAMGRYPVEAVRMMAGIAISSERHRKELSRRATSSTEVRGGTRPAKPWEIISRNVQDAAEAVKARFILTPTQTGATARRISRFKPDSWILAFSRRPEAAGFLLFSYGVYPFIFDPGTHGWYESISAFLKKAKIAKTGDTAVLTQGQYSSPRQTTDSLSIVTIP